MTTYVYCVRDSKSGFTSPVLSASDDLAKRDFFFAVSHDNALLANFPVDFDLYRVGSFDTVTGILTPITPLVHIANAKEAL